MTALLIIAGIAALLLFSKTSTGQQLLSSVTSALPSVTWYVPTDADITNIVNRYRGSHDKYWNYLFNTVKALQITSDLFNPASSFCQAVGYGSTTTDPTGASPLISQQLGQGVNEAMLGVNTVRAVGNLAEGASFATSAVGSALKAVPIVGAVITPFLMAFNFISQHHAAAVKKENLIACPLVPQINAIFSNIKSQLYERQVTGAQALAALQQLQQNAAKVASADPSSGAIQLIMDGVNGIVDNFTLIIQRTGA